MNTMNPSCEQFESTPPICDRVAAVGPVRLLSWLEATPDPSLRALLTAHVVLCSHCSKIYRGATAQVADQPEISDSIASVLLRWTRLEPLRPAWESALGDETERARDVELGGKQVILTDHFPEELLAKRLPWAQPTIRLLRNAGGCFASASRNPEGGPLGTLVIEARDEHGRLASARLTARFYTDAFSPDLTGEWTDIVLRIEG